MLKVGSADMGLAVGAENPIVGGIIGNAVPIIGGAEVGGMYGAEMPPGYPYGSGC